MQARAAANSSDGPVPVDAVAVPPSDSDVLAAVRALLVAYRSPTTSLIIWHLAKGRPRNAAFQHAVRAALERLRQRRQVVCVTHRGRRRWSLPATDPARR